MMLWRIPETIKPPVTYGMAGSRGFRGWRDTMAAPGVTPVQPTSRRDFLKWGAIAGLGAAGALGGFWALWKYALNLTYPRYVPLKPWELEPGVVNYDLVRAYGYGPAELGFVNDIGDAPAESRILNVAQWYDYWPGRIVAEFGPYMSSRWGIEGVSVRWTPNIFTSNEELLQWVLEDGRTFDVMFPANYAVEALEKAGALVNLNREWIPDYVNILGRFPASWPPGFEPVRSDLTHFPSYPDSGNGYNNDIAFDLRDPAANAYAYRMPSSVYPSPRGMSHVTWDEANSLLAVPYQWMTTGIGYRTDIFDRTGIEALGWEVFELTSYSNPVSGETHPLANRKMMLDEMREVFGAALKAVGGKRQVDAGLPLTGIPRNPAPPWNGEYQWSTNETDPAKTQAAVDWARSIRDSLWGFNTPQQGPWLVNGTMYVDQARSGDVMYAIRPNSNQFLPVDFFVPLQGSSRVVDAAVIGRSCDSLWLAHEFLNYLLQPDVGADISSWNLYPTPNAWSFNLLHADPSYSYYGQYPDGSPYVWNPAEDARLYADLAFGYAGPSVLERCELQHDLDPDTTLRYETAWEDIRY